MLSRRVLLGSAVAAPFVVRAGLLMPVSTRLIPPWGYPNVVHWTFWRPQPFVVMVKKDDGKWMVLSVDECGGGSWLPMQAAA